jgi:hypothetical protein
MHRVIHHGCGEYDRRSTDLPDEVRSATEAGDGELSGLVKVREGANEVSLVDQNPIAHVLGFEIGAEGVEGRDFGVEDRHGKILIRRARWMHFVTALEHDVMIEIRQKVKKREARVRVVSAA